MDASPAIFELRPTIPDKPSSEATRPRRSHGRKRQWRLHRRIYLSRVRRGSDQPFRGNATLPILSTDTARLVVLSSTNSNDIEWFFSNTYFSIRPDPGLGCKLPGCTSLRLPRDRLSRVEVWFRLPGRLRPSKDCARLTSSLDRWRQTYHLITTDLRANTRSLNWQLPASSGIPDVRVRVIARDKLFQNSSDGAGIVFSITP